MKCFLASGKASWLLLSLTLTSCEREIFFFLPARLSAARTRISPQLDCWPQRSHLPASRLTSPARKEPTFFFPRRACNPQVVQQSGHTSTSEHAPRLTRPYRIYATTTVRHVRPLLCFLLYLLPFSPSLLLSPHDVG
jgi:hypothetical protein